MFYIKIRFYMVQILVSFDVSLGCRETKNRIRRPEAIIIISVTKLFCIFTFKRKGSSKQLTSCYKNTSKCFGFLIKFTK